MGVPLRSPRLQPRRKTVRDTPCVVLLFTWLVSEQGVAKKVVGGVERVRLHEFSVPVLAKLDTGAVTSSLNARDIGLFEKEGPQYVRFIVTNWQGGRLTVERPVVRFVDINKHFGTKQGRPVVHLGVRLGNRQEQVEVNLVDRPAFDYQFLMSRTFIAGELPIDPGQTYLTEPGCHDSRVP